MSSPDAQVANLTTSEAETLHSVRHGFISANTHFLIPKGVFSEYVSQIALCTIPGTPAWFLGIANHRGETIPVFDLDTAFEAQTTPAPRKGVLLLGSHPNTVGIALRQSPTVLINPEPVDEPATSPELRPFLTESFLVKGQVWFNVDHHRLFSDLRARF